MVFVPKDGHAATRIYYSHIDICIVINVPPTAEKMKRTYITTNVITLKFSVAIISPTLSNFANLLNQRHACIHSALANFLNLYINLYIAKF